MIAGLLLLGILVFGGGSIFAATRPTWTAPMTAVAPRGASGVSAKEGSKERVTMATRTLRTKGSGAKAAPNAKAHSPQASTSSAPISYTVKSGDTLSGIAEWFKLHGYGSLYKANMAVIGADPNLIFPGQKITIAHGKMSMASPARNGAGA